MSEAEPLPERAVDRCLDKRIDEYRRTNADHAARSSTRNRSIAPNLLLRESNASLLAAKNKRTELLMKYDASYPLVKEVDQEIDGYQGGNCGNAEKAKVRQRTTDRDPTYELLREDLTQDARRFGVAKGYGRRSRQQHQRNARSDGFTRCGHREAGRVASRAKRPTKPVTSST